MAKKREWSREETVEVARALEMGFQAQVLGIIGTLALIILAWVLLTAVYEEAGATHTAISGLLWFQVIAACVWFNWDMFVTMRTVKQAVVVHGR